MTLVANTGPEADREPPETMTAEQQRRRRARSLAIAAALAALVVLFYVVTIVKLGSNVASRAL
jgi:hypothetical protein